MCLEGPQVELKVDKCKPLPGGAHRGSQGQLGRRRLHGRAVQVDPIKPKLTAPGCIRLKLKCDDPLSKFAFNFKLRRYNLSIQNSLEQVQSSLAQLPLYGARAARPRPQTLDPQP